MVCREKIEDIVVLVPQGDLTAESGHDELKSAIADLAHEGNKIAINLGEITEIDDFCATSLGIIMGLVAKQGARLLIFAPANIADYLESYGTSAIRDGREETIVASFL